MTENNLSKLLLIAGVFIGVSLQPAFGQDDLLNMLEDEQGPTTDYAFATFKGTKVVNLQSPEIPGKGVLQYVIAHRFGSFKNDFFYNFMGLDNAQVRLSLDYSFTDWLNIGISHASFKKTYDAFAKYRLIRQSKGVKNFPFTITGFSSVYYENLRFNDQLDHKESERLSYVHQLVIARKFNKRFSAELVPTLVHANIVDKAEFSNDAFALGLGGRYKLTHQYAVTLEYIHQFTPYNYTDANGEITDYNNSLSVGFDIETGGHVFQLFLTNSSGVSEPFVITETNNSWLDGDIHFGFNISRVFTIVKPKMPSEN